MTRTIKPWARSASEILLRTPVFSVRRDRLSSPRTGREGDYFITEMPDWVNVVALTNDAKLILVRQYRFGTESVTLEIPGGVIEDGENPTGAGLRELLEETGYKGDEVEYLGVVHPNPAIADNACHTILVRGCHQTGAQNQDPGEDIAVELMDRSAVRRAVLAGKITHSLVVAGLYLADI